MKRCALKILAAVALCTVPLRAQDSVVIFNELNYHPLPGDAEWIELHNEMSVNVDLSAWKLTGGIDYVFPEGTVIAAGGYVVIRGAGSSFPPGAIGPWTGQLDNAGETVKLRNVSGRVMDTISYKDGGRWPVGADGTGATLSRRSPFSPADDGKSWVASAQTGGTPAALNFPGGPLTSPPVTLVNMADAWLYNQTGPSLPSNWSTGTYTAGTDGWASGTGLFAYESGTLPLPVGTALANPTSTPVHYFQKSFTFSGDPATAVLRASLLVDDGAAVYLNGHEVYRQNLQDGTVTSATRASSSVGKAALMTDIALPTDYLVAGANVLSVSVHQPTAAAPYVALTGGIVLAEEGGALDATNDLALASKGSVAFAKDLLGNGIYAPTHTIPNLNNGTYGNGSSWIGNTNNSFCGVKISATPVTVRSIAFGRDNTGTYADRTLGLYTLQYTTDASASASTPDASWTTIGTLSYDSAGGGANFAAPSKRHRYNFSAVNATALRLIAPGNGISTGTCIDEIEIYAQAGTVVVPQPLTIAPASGYAVTWDGVNGPTPRLTVPYNLALATEGSAAIGSGELGPSLGLAYHLISMANDGQYGNTHSWIGANAANQWLGVRFPAAVTVNKVAWSRDNSGTYNDRTLGTYTIQVTTVANPTAATTETGVSATGWKTVGTVTYAFSDPTFAQGVRHEFAISEGGASIPATGLRVKVSDPGTCIDEIEAYGAEPPDVVFGMSLSAAQLLPSAQNFPLTINEVGGANDPVWKIELRNAGSSAIDLGGISLNGHSLPAGSLAAGALIVLDETQLGFRPTSSDKLALTVSGNLLDAAPVAATVRARVGDDWLKPTAATFGAANAVTLSTGVAINEIMYHAPPFPAGAGVSTTDNPAEWIELKNTTASPIDLAGWSLDGEIGYTFGPDTILPASGFIVVAGSGGTPPPGALGPYQGSLSNSHGRIALKDANGNPTDEVRYVGTGWSDGGGSSLELRDARADNADTTTAAWQASDESAKSSWQTFSYRMTAGQAFGPTTWNELRLGMLDAAECLIDDVSVVRDPDGAHQELVQNGSFSSGSTAWRFLGNHRRSAVVPEPGNAANNVLRLIASGPAETNHNHIESTFIGNTALVNGTTYEVTFRARWIAGTNQLNVKAYYSKLAKTVELPIPTDLGTPGAPNSRSLPNAGPLLTGLRHDPAVPAVGQSAIVSVKADDPDGVTSMTLFYKADLAPTFTQVPMTLAGAIWSAAIPSQAAGTIIQFYVAGEDSLAAAATAPDGGASSRALIQWADGQDSTLAAQPLRLIMLKADSDFLLATNNRVSNERQPGTLIAGSSEIFYDVGVRLQGTPAGRVRDGEAYPGYDIACPPNRPFRGVHENINIDRSGRAPTVRGQDEIFLKYSFHRAGVPCTFDDLCWFIAPNAVHTGTAILQLAAYGGSFTDSQFDKDGTVFNFDVTYDPTTTTDGQPQSEKPPVPFIHVATDFTSLGTDKEQYRGPLDIRAGRRADNYAGVMAFCQAMGQPTAQLPAQAAPLLDLSTSLRCAALVNLWAVGDTYYTGDFQHNIRLFVPDDGSGITLLPWDNDFVASKGATAPLYPTGNNLGRLIGSSPAILRLYYGHLQDLCQTVFKSSALSPWMSHYGSVVGQSMTGTATFVDARRNYVLGQLPASVPFAITTNGGASFSIAANQATLDGTGWVNIREFRRVGSADPVPITWLTNTTWRVTLPLASGPNAITLQAVDYQGAVIGTVSLTVTNTLPAVSPRDFLRLTELHFHPANPSTVAELAASGADTDFEFIEVKNIGSETLDLTGVHFGVGLVYTFPNGTLLPGGQFLVVPRNTAAFQARYGMAIALAAPFAPESLNNAGETVTLLDATGAEIQTVTFGDRWFPSADGGGHSLVVRNEGAAAPNLNDPASWELSFQLHGNPGASNGAVFSTEFEGWRHQNFAEGLWDDASTEKSGDPAASGVSNFLRYALVIPPAVPADSMLPAVQYDGNFIQIAFRRRLHALDATYTVQSTDSLGAWADVTTPPTSVVNNGDGSESVTVRFAASSGRTFVRLLVTAP